MAEKKIFFSRFQTKADTELREVCRTLKQQGRIHRFFICRWHYTNMIVHEGDKPLPLKEVNDLLHAFEGDDLSALRDILNEHDTESQADANESGYGGASMDE